MKCMAPTKTTRLEVQPGVILDSRRALYLARARLLVVADLHWGYAASHRAAGNLLPLWGDGLIASTLRTLLEEYRPAGMLWLGDSLHALPGRAAAESFLEEVQGWGVPVTILAGNHDRRWSVPAGRTLERDGYIFHHGDQELSPPRGLVEVIGHHHPAATLRDGAGARVRLAALVASPARLILPAFSPWAAGVAWNERLDPGENLWAIAPSRIFAVRSAQPPGPAALS